MDSLPQLVRDLIRVGVGVEVRVGRPVLRLPEGEPARSSARRVVRACLDVIRERRADVLRLWPEVAAEAEPARSDVPVRCRECSGLVIGVKPAAANVVAAPVSECIGRSFCEFLFCPYRTDERAARYQQRHYPPHIKRDWREKLERQRELRRRALGGFGAAAGLTDAGPTGAGQ